MKKLNVLLVEDHEADRRLVEEALEDCQVKVDLSCLTDGEQAIQYIQGQGNFKGARRPDLIILDLNMPLKDGHQFLDEVHHILKEEEIPVVLLSVSDDPADIGKAMDKRMNYFMSKPVNAGRLDKILHAVSHLWMPVSK